MPATHNMHDAKTHLSELAERASRGEEIVIARNGQPLARLVALDERPRRRKLGLWQDEEVWVSDTFDQPLPAELQRHFEGGDAD